MAFTVEALTTTPVSQPTSEPNQFNLPSKEYVTYDPNTVPVIDPSQEGQIAHKPNPAANVKQADTTETTEAPAESVTLSPQISALARKEQATRQREKALAQREKELATKLADAEKYQELKTKVAAKDFSAVEELGVDYEPYTAYLVDKQNSQDPVEQRYRKVESEIEQLKKQQEEQTIQEYQANQALWKQEVVKVVDSSEEFSAIKELGLHGAVLKHINDSFDEDGVELTAEQAAKEILQALDARAEKLASVSRFKTKFGEPSKVLGPPKTSPKTITQNMTVTSEKTKSKPFHLMSDSEQIAEAYRRVQAAKQQR